MEVGKPPTKLTITAEATAEGVMLRGGALRAMLPMAALAELSADSVLLRGGRKIAVIRATSGAAQAAALVSAGAHGKPEVSWVGRLDLHGDPGERVADGLLIEDRDGDGQVDVVVGSYDERIRICGQERTLIGPRALDAEGRLRPVALQRVERKAAAVETVLATTAGPGPTEPPLLRALRGQAASSVLAGASLEAAFDGKPETAWIDGAGAGGRFEFLVMRWQAAPEPIRALAVTFAAQGESATAAMPQALSLVMDGGQRLDLTIPPDAKPGQRLWLVPKAPLRTACLSLAIDTVSTSEAGAHAAIAEIEAYTDYDFAGGSATLVTALADEGSRGADAAETVLRAKLDVTAALVDAWPKLGPQGRRRALRIVAPRVPDDAQALGLVERGLADTQAEVRGAALELALSAWPQSERMLAAAIARAGAAGDDAALALARQRRTEALAALLAALAADRGTERPVLRESIRTALDRSGAAPVAGLEPEGKPVGLRAALALALAGVPERRGEAARLVRASVGDASEFVDRWRLVEAASTCDADGEIDAWLANQARSAKEWMLRDAALAALARRGSPLAEQTARAALSDPYPRVRVSALGALASTKDGVELLAKSSRDDSWFLVRIGALDALPAGPDAEAVLVAAARDRTASVRVAALRGLRRLRLASAWPTVRERLAKADEYPEVIREGIAFARALCLSHSADTLRAVVSRGLKPDAWAPDQELALLALEALSALGGEATRWASEQSRSPLVPEPVRVAIQKRAASGAGCQPE